MNRDQVLTHHAHDEDTTEDAPLRGARHTRRIRLISVAQLFDDPIRQQARQTRVSDRHSERSQKRIGQGDLGTTGKAFLESNHRTGTTHSGHQAPHQ